MHFCVEQAAPQDLPGLEELLEFCLGERASRPGQLKGIRFLLENPSRGRIGVVREGDRIVAMASLVSTVSTAQGGLVLWVEDWWIDPAHRGRGCEALLLGHALDYARENGFSRITLLPSAGMTQDDLRLWSEQGFEPSGMIPLRATLA